MLKKVDVNVLINLKRSYEMKQRILNAIFSKEFREQVVKHVAEERLNTEAMEK